MPLLTLDSLAAGASTDLDGCPPIGLEHVNSLSLTVECTYHEEARTGLRVRFFPSWDGLSYDTDPMHTFENHFRAGGSCRRTVCLDVATRFARIQLENLDTRRPIRDVKAIATLGCA